MTHTTPPPKKPEEHDFALPNDWPMVGPSFNSWYKDLSGFAKILENAGAFWCMDWQLKYLSLWTDTRDGGFLIFDRDKNKIEASRVLAAIKEWDDQTGEYTKNIRAALLQAQDVKVVGVDSLKMQTEEYDGSNHDDHYNSGFWFGYNRCLSDLAREYPAGLVLKGSE